MEILGSQIGLKDFSEKWMQEKTSKKLPTLLEKLTILSLFFCLCCYWIVPWHWKSTF